MLLKFIRDLEPKEENITEEVLTEKCWVKITPTNSEDSFYFYAKDLNKKDKDVIKKDIDDLINHIRGKSSGSYKQSLHKPAKDKFRRELLSASDMNNLYTFEILDSIDSRVNSDFILSQTDRDLRKIATSLVMNSQDNLLKPSDNKRVLIHHIDGKEYNNDIQNISVIEYTENYATDGSLDLAHAVHKILHAMCKDNKDLKAKLEQTNNTYLASTVLKFIDPEDSSSAKAFNVFIGVTERK